MADRVSLIGRVASFFSSTPAYQLASLLRVLNPGDFVSENVNDQPGLAGGGKVSLGYLGVLLEKDSQSPPPLKRRG